ncbi:putative carboxylesterase [Helianthus annuus]|nr:putative carboxylesterase [Helianthus annuus]
MARKVSTDVDYRLASEHRYPVKYNDFFHVLNFLDVEESWPKSLLENANLSRCILARDAGDSAARKQMQNKIEPWQDGSIWVVFISNRSNINLAKRCVIDVGSCC